ARHGDVGIREALNVQPTRRPLLRFQQRFDPAPLDPTRDEDDAAAAVIRRPPAVSIRSGYAVAHRSGCNRRRCPTSRKVWTRDRRDELESVASRRQLGKTEPI